MKQLIISFVLSCFFIAISISVSAQPTNTPGMSKLELKQIQAQKKLEKKIRKAKLKEAKAKAKEYTLMKSQEGAKPTAQPGTKPSAKNPNIVVQKQPKDKTTKKQKPQNPNLKQKESVVKTTKAKVPKQSKVAANPKIKKEKPGPIKSGVQTAPKKTKVPGLAGQKSNKQPTGKVKPTSKVKKMPQDAGNSKVATSGSAAQNEISENMLDDAGPIVHTRTKPTAVLANTTVKESRRESDCSFTYITRDAMTGQTKKALTPRYFFGYTEPELKEFMKGEDFLTCSGFLSEVTGVKTLNLTFTMESPYARDEYGSLQVGSQVIIRLLNGETVTLLSEKYDSGSVISRSSKTVYKSIFVVTLKDEKTLMRSEIDMVRVVWGAGYEDYEVYELDFLIDQLECLKNAK